MAGHNIEDCARMVWDHLLGEVRRVVREEFAAQQKAVPATLPLQLSVAEAGQIANRCPDTIRHAIKQGKLKATKPEGSREWLIQQIELQRWIGGSKKKGPPLDLQAEIDKSVAKALL